MIPLVLKARAEPGAPFVARLRCAVNGPDDSRVAQLIASSGEANVFASENGLFSLEGVAANDLEGDVLLITPETQRAERLLRAGSPHNTLLVTERCDQLCLMCSQPPKKTHDDRFAYLTEACLLAEPEMLIGISGGEPTLYKTELFGMIETVLTARPDLRFHVLSNGQHFETTDIARLSQPLWRRVAWGIPLYAANDALHDRIVGKAGGATRLRESFAHLILAGARIELRTVVIRDNLAHLPDLAAFVTAFLPGIEQWSIMQLEHAGFARRRWGELYADHGGQFGPIGAAIDRAELAGIDVRLFNFPRCTVPPSYRPLAVASISDWKRRYADTCASCREAEQCPGFFEWHPDHAMGELTPL